MPDTQTTNAEQSQQEYQKAVRQLTETYRQNTRESVNDYEFDTVAGKAQLSELFGAHDELIAIHNMGKSCVYCTLWADGFNGVLAHLENRAGFVVVSPDPPTAQAEFAESRGWRFRMVSAENTSFFKDMGFEDAKGGPMPGVSTFCKNPDGTIRRSAAAPFGPGDLYCAVWHLFDLLENGVNDWSPKYRY